MPKASAFNFFSHGTEDLYPTFLQVQRKFPQPTVAAIAIIYNIGGIIGGAMLWHVLRENRPPQSDLHCGTANFADHSLVGVLVQSILAGSRGFRDAVPGPGRLGCNSS